MNIGIDWQNRSKKDEAPAVPPVRRSEPSSRIEKSEEWHLVNFKGVAKEAVTKSEGSK